jgi:hypothetical protein
MHGDGLKRIKKDEGAPAADQTGMNKMYVVRVLVMTA